MARLILLTVGVPSESAIRELVSAYIRRMRPPFWEMEWQTVKEVSYQRGQETQAKIKEAQKLLSKIPENALMVLLDVKGVQWSTEALLVAVRNWRDSGRPVVFVVGGSLGVDFRGMSICCIPSHEDDNDGRGASRRLASPHL